MLFVLLQQKQKNIKYKAPDFFFKHRPPLTFLMAPSSRSTAALLDFQSLSLYCSLVLLSVPPPSSCPPLPITPLSSFFAPNLTITLPTPDASTLFRLDFWQVSDITISTRTSAPCPSPSATTIGQCCSWWDVKMTGRWAEKEKEHIHVDHTKSFLKMCSFFPGKYLIVYGDDIFIQCNSGEEEVFGIVHVQRCHGSIAVLDPCADHSFLKVQKKNGVADIFRFDLSPRCLRISINLLATSI